MGDDLQRTVSTSRRIAAPADVIFNVLTSPGRHQEMDGSGMLRGSDSPPITGVGDVFVMRMFFAPLGGDYQMVNHVVEFEPGRRIAWEPENGPGHPEADAPNARWGHRWGFDLVPDGPAATSVTEWWDGSRVPADEAEDGRQWIPSMQASLRRLEQMLND
jgi:Polyketide cyclase / dehydrase and lipid transport